MGAMLFSITVNAQTVPAHKFALSLAVDGGIPTGAEAHGTKFTLGGDIRLQYGLTESLALTLTTGGYHFFPKQNLENMQHRESFGLGPIKGGLKLFLAPRWYFGAEAGVAYMYTEHGYSGDPPKLILSPQFGTVCGHWDFSIWYDNYSGQNYSYGQAALRIAYGFQL